MRRENEANFDYGTYFFSNISAKNHQNLFMYRYVKVRVSQIRAHPVNVLEDIITDADILGPSLFHREVFKGRTLVHFRNIFIPRVMF